MKIKSKIMKETKSIPFKVLIDILEDTSNELKKELLNEYKDKSYVFKRRR